LATRAQGILILAPDVQFPLLMLAKKRRFMLLMGGETPLLFGLKGRQRLPIPCLLQLQAPAFLSLMIRKRRRIPRRR
jgi:hypothetical protein